MKFLRDLNLKKKRVLVRVDFNEPIKNGELTSDFRIKAAIPTIEYLLAEESKIILVTHLGRPDGKIIEELRTDPIAECLKKLIGRPVKKLDGYEVSQSEEEIILLENVQFHPGEKSKDPQFIGELAELADFFVLDAFGQAHRDYASISGLSDVMPSCAGLLLEKEIKTLSRVLGNSGHPLVFIIGGAKISTKMKVIENFLEKADNVLLGGALANTVLKAKGIDVKKSVVEDEMLEQAEKILKNPKLYLPTDWIFSDEMILDIGPKAIEEFKEIILKAKTVVFNGPMGLFEKDQFKSGSEEIARAVADNSGYSLAGGGDTIALLEGLNLLDKISHVSTGGGAMLDFLAGKKLPGIEALK
ncbi:MAG: phosphoglycerate kinase [Candidatus Portnoybacteria bacterium]